MKQPAPLISTQIMDNDAGRFKKAASGVVGKRLTYKQLTGKDQGHETENQTTA